jgi:cytochrome P450
MTVTAPTPTRFDPFASPDFAGLHDLLKRTRDESPVLFSEDLHMWVVTRYDDALAVLRDPDVFTSSTRPVILSQFVDEARTLLERTHTFAAPNMGFDGNPDHDRLRRPVARYLSARGVAAIEPRIRRIAAACLDRVPATGTFDLMGTFARPLADAVILDLVGVPAEDHERVLRYQEATNAFFFGAPPPDVQVPYAREVVAFEDYLADLVDRRRGDPRDDLTSHLLEQVAEAEADYTDDELISLLAFDIVTAGIRPIAFAIVTMCRQLLEGDRTQWELLAQNPSRFDGAFSESLRRYGLSLGVYRQAAKDVEVAGVTIPAGGVVWVMVCSAGHDESRFACPATFDPERTNLGSSLHFSHGLHYCLGASLARAATRVGLEALMARHRGLRVVADQQLTYEPSFNLMVPQRFLVDAGQGTDGAERAEGAESTQEAEGPEGEAS